MRARCPGGAVVRPGSRRRGGTRVAGGSGCRRGSSSMTSTTSPRRSRPSRRGRSRTAAGGVEGDAGSGDPAAHHQHVERLVAEASQRIGVRQRGALIKTAASAPRRSTGRASAAVGVAPRCSTIGMVREGLGATHRAPPSRRGAGRGPAPAARPRTSRRRRRPRAQLQVVDGGRTEPGAPGLLDRHAGADGIFCCAFSPFGVRRITLPRHAVGVRPRAPRSRGVPAIPRTWRCPPATRRSAGEIAEHVSPRRRGHAGCWR